MLIEYPDVDERRRRAGANCVGIETPGLDAVAGFDPVMGIADEDLEREHDEKTSAVHFLRFELDAPSHGWRRCGKGADLAAGVDHPAYTDCFRRDRPGSHPRVADRRSRLTPLGRLSGRTD